MEDPDGLELLASLADPTRRAVYEFVVNAPSPVSRDDAASGLGVPRHVAAYHLDRLVADGLLSFESRRLSGRTGPGAGRPAKLYSRSHQVLEVSIPVRRYLLAAQILLQSISEDVAPSEAARRRGREVGQPGLQQALKEIGYEPSVERSEIRFRNCPFDALRAQDRETICKLNHHLVTGIVEGSRSKRVAVLEPEDGYCCVRIRHASAS
jgi:predicted ArsR family transcriptional regulator